MTDTTFGKVAKQGKRKMVEIPAKDARHFNIGDPVWVKRITRPK